MYVLAGRINHHGVITGGFGKFSSGTYLDLAKAITQKVQGHINEVRLPDGDKPYVVLDIRPTVTDRRTAGPSGTILGVMRNLGRLQYDNNPAMQIGGVGPSWVYLPSGMRYSIRGSTGFADGLLLLQADLTR